MWSSFIWKRGFYALCGFSGHQGSIRVVFIMVKNINEITLQDILVYPISELLLRPIFVKDLYKSLLNQFALSILGLDGLQVHLLLLEVFYDILGWMHENTSWSKFKHFCTFLNNPTVITIGYCSNQCMDREWALEQILDRYSGKIRIYGAVFYLRAFYGLSLMRSYLPSKDWLSFEWSDPSIFLGQ